MLGVRSGWCEKCFLYGAPGLGYEATCFAKVGRNLFSHAVAVRALQRPIPGMRMNKKVDKKGNACATKKNKLQHAMFTPHTSDSQS